MDDYCDTRRSTTKSTDSRPAKSPTAAPEFFFTPNFDVREADNYYFLDGELPGVHQDNIEIEFTDPETMVIKGRVERNYNTPDAHHDDTASIHSDDDASSIKSNYHSPTVEDEDEASTKGTSRATDKATPEHSRNQPAAFKYWASERQVGNFQRSFNFPARINQDGVKATLRNGILSVTVPKETIKKAKRIRIE